MRVAVKTATFSLFGVQVRVHVLDDGQRVIDVADVNALFDAMASDAAPELHEAELRRMTSFIRGER